jgi:O-antigen/teichoic acid export membrane protein
MRDKVVRGGTAVILRQIVSLPINAVGVALTSRLLLPADFGIQAILVPVTAFVVMVVDLGTSQALVQGKSPAGPLLLRRVQQLKFTDGLIITGALALLSSWVVQIFSLSSSLVLLLPACGLLGWLQSQRAYQAVTLQRRVEWQTLARVEMGEIIVYNLALVATAYLLRSAWCFVLALGLRYTLGAVLLKLRNQAHAEAPLVRPTGSMGSLLRFGIPLQATMLFGILNSLANPVLVGGMVGLAGVGIVNWSSYIVSLPMVLFLPLPSFLFSILAERRRQAQNDNETIAGFVHVGSVFVALLSLWLVLSLDWLVRYVFGAQWIDAVPVTSLMMLSNIFMFPTLVLTAHLTAHGHSTIWLIINIVSTALLWGITAVVTHQLGAVGYAIGWMAACFIQMLLLCTIVRRLAGLNSRWSDSLYLVLAVCCTIVIVDRFRFPFGHISLTVQSVLKILIGSFVFVVAMLPLEYVRKREWQVVFSLLPFKKQSC